MSPSAPPSRLQLVDAPYDDPRVTAMVAELQAEYVVRYGEQDATPLLAEDFAPPTGAFLVAVAGEDVVGCAGLRAAPDLGERVVEAKRMYVRAAHRRRGHARALLAALEQRARDLGARRLVLETGTEQPEALALYRGAGYAAVAPYGHYAEAEASVHLGKDL